MAQDQKSIDVYSGFFGHLLLEEFVSDYISSESTFENNKPEYVPDAFLRIFQSWLNDEEEKLTELETKCFTTLVAELKLGQQLQQIIVKFSVPVLPDAETKRLEDLKEQLTTFYQEKIENEPQVSFHVQGGYLNHQNHNGHAIGWTFLPQGLVLTNSGEGLEYHQRSDDDRSYVETIVYQPYPQEKGKLTLSLFTKMMERLIDNHRLEQQTITKVYTEQVPSFMSGRNSILLLAGQKLFSGKQPKYEAPNEYDEVPKDPLFKLDRLATRPRFFIQAGRMFTLPQLTGSCAFFCTAWYIQMRIGQLMNIKKIDPLWRALKRRVLTHLKVPALANFKEMSDLIQFSKYRFDIYRLLYQRYHYVEDPVWQEKREQIRDYLANHPLF